MRFVNPLFLIGLGGAALPLLIHLLTRDRIRRVPFSSLRFFLRSSSRILKRKKFQEAILLLLRTIICALLAVAFARPLLTAPPDDVAAATEARTARVLVVDVSGSMARGLSPEQAAKRLSQAATDALEGLSDGEDAAALITFADTTTVLAPLTRDFAALKGRIADLQVGHGGTDIADALHHADALLKRIQAATREITLISDLQRSGWDSAKAGAFGKKISNLVTLKIRPLTPPSAGPTGPVIAETDFSQSVVYDGAPRHVAVRVANPTAGELKGVAVRLTLGGETVRTKKVNIRAASSAPVRFQHVFDSPGDNPGEIHAGAAPPDDGNTMYFNTRVIPRIRVVILNGRVTGDPADDGAFFLVKALVPITGAEGGGDIGSPFAVRTVSASAAVPEDIDGARVAIVANADNLPTAARDSLGALLQRGGGVFFLPGGAVKADTFNRQFADLAPCRLREVRRPRAELVKAGVTTGAMIGKIDYDHAIFEVFRQPHHGDFTTTRFFRWWEVGDSQTSRVSARFDDDRPAVLERQIGRGISMMLAGSTDLQWGNFPLRAIFLPYLHQTVRYLAVRSERDTACRVGQVIDVPEGAVLKDPDGKDLTGQVVLDRPGFYRLAGADGADRFCYAVNADPAEADSEAVSPAEIVAAAQLAPGEEGAELTATEKADREQQDTQNLWWYIAAALVGLFVLELLVANRTIRH